MAGGCRLWEVTEGSPRRYSARRDLLAVGEGRESLPICTHLPFFCVSRGGRTGSLSTKRPAPPLGTGSEAAQETLREASL